MAIEGKHKTFKLRHGDQIREFKDVVVSHPMRKVLDPTSNKHVKTDQRVDDDDDRWELAGTELKREAVPTRGIDPAPTRIVEVEVEVGFLPENVVDD